MRLEIFTEVKQSLASLLTNRLGMKAETHRRPWEVAGRDWSYASVSQGTQRMAVSHQKLQETKKNSSLAPSEHAHANTVISDF